MKFYSSDDAHLNDNMTDVKYFIIELVLEVKFVLSLGILSKVCLIHFYKLYKLTLENFNMYSIYLLVSF